MGGLFSQEISSEDEVLKIRDSLGLTPSQQLHNSRLHDVRLLALDPRSPSAFINRTPIIVEKTPELQAKKMKPSIGDMDILHDGPVIKDPRSPTRDFTRTPINPCLSSSEVIVRRNVQATIHTEETSTHGLKLCLKLTGQPPVFGSDPKASGEAMSLSEKPESEKTRSLLKNPESGENKCALENLESRDIDQGSEVLEKDLNSHENLVDATKLDVSDADCDDDVCDSDTGCNNSVECDDIAECDDDGDCKKMESSTQAVDNKLILRVKYVEESTPKLAALIPTKSDNRIRMKPKMLSLQANLPRSPLCAVQNSPRILSKSRPNHTNNNVLDKENVFH